MAPTTKLPFLFSAAIFLTTVLSAQADITALQKSFEQPPGDAKMMVRWWWFGPAVTKDGIMRELTAMKAGGIQGVELQTTYALALDGPDTKNLKFLSPEHLEMIAFAAARCKELGLRMDLTLGSGWPYGGPMFTPDEGAGRLETQIFSVTAGQNAIPIPQLLRGRKLIAAFTRPAGATGGGGRGRGPAPASTDASALKEAQINNGTIQLPENFPGGEVVLFISGRTGMAVKRPAVGAEGPVIDHLSATVVDKFIREVAEPQLQACGNNPPFAIFCDSLEINGENWTDDFLAEFQKRRGYDLKPFLPALLGTIGDSTEAIRHDYGQTVTDLFNENFNAKFSALAKKYNTRFRIQGYGSPAAGLASYAFADLPEGEAGGNANWRTFRTTRYASSASHLMNVPMSSSETFTWLHGAPFRATPLDIKGEGDLHFLEGITQFICHGWPYTPQSAAYPGYSFYAAAVFDDKNPWYIAMPDINIYVSRVSTLLRAGTPANDIALYLDDADQWSRATTAFSSLNAAYTSQSTLLAEILDSGYNLDAFDDGMLAMKGKAAAGTLAFGNIHYKIVLLNNPQHMPLATARQLEQFTKTGGTLIAIGNPPAKVPGYKATSEDQQELTSIMSRLFKDPGAPGILVPAENQLREPLAKKLSPDVALDPATASVGAIHRHTPDAEIYFLANTGPQKQHLKATFRVAGLQPEMWNPLSGKITPLTITTKSQNTTTIDLDLDPLASSLILWTKRAYLPVDTTTKTIGLGTGWTIQFGDAAKPLPLEKFNSWLAIDDMKNFSGIATYQNKIIATTDMLKSSLSLTFGTPIPTATASVGRAQGYVAPIDSPIRDAAVVYVNGIRAGAVWCPPFTLDITGLLKEGENTLRIQVANTAVNALSAHTFPNYDYDALTKKYGNKFQPQNSTLLTQPLPSGLLAPIQLDMQSK